MNDLKMIKLSDCLTENRVRFYSKPVTKLLIFTDLIGRLHYPNPEAALEAILEREKSGSTILTPGVSLPHARMIDMPDVAASLGICLDGVEEPKATGTIRIFLLFLGPSNYMKRNLDFLAAVSSLFSNEGFADSLIGCTEPQQVLETIRRAEQNI